MKRRVWILVITGLLATGYVGVQAVTANRGHHDAGTVMPILPPLPVDELGTATPLTPPTTATRTLAGSSPSPTSPPATASTATGPSGPTDRSRGTAAKTRQRPVDGMVPLIRAGAAVPTSGPDGPPGVVASVETELFPGVQGDQADDSAVWRNPVHPERSFVLADNKADSGGGVAVYDLKGKLVGYQSVGKIGNIDLRSGVRVGNRTVTLVGANNRTDATMRFWSLDPNSGALTSLDARRLPTVDPNYGFCLGRSSDGKHTYAFVSGQTSFVFEQYELRMTTGKIDAVKVRTLDIGSLSEACVVDDARDALYVAEEDVAVWRYALDPATGASRTAIDTVSAGRLTADIEGVSLARGTAGRGVLVVSSQGDSTYSVYDLDGQHAFLGTFKVKDSPLVDGASDTDGLDISSGSFGPSFPNGLLVVHDGKNSTSGGEPAAGSNLKFVRFDQVFALTA